MVPNLIDFVFPILRIIFKAGACSNIHDSVEIVVRNDIWDADNPFTKTLNHLIIL